MLWTPASISTHFISEGTNPLREERSKDFTLDWITRDYFKSWKTCIRSKLCAHFCNDALFFFIERRIYILMDIRNFRKYNESVTNKRQLYVYYMLNITQIEFTVYYYPFIETGVHGDPWMFTRVHPSTDSNTCKTQTLK